MGRFFTPEVLPRTGARSGFAGAERGPAGFFSFSVAMVCVVSVALWGGNRDWNMLLRPAAGREGSGRQTEQLAHRLAVVALAHGVGVVV